MKQAIVHIALVVRDYDEAIEFYTQKLHFELIEDLYGNLWDLLQLNSDHPVFNRSREISGKPIFSLT